EQLPLRRQAVRPKKVTMVLLTDDVVESHSQRVRENHVGQPCCRMGSDDEVGKLSRRSAEWVRRWSACVLSLRLIHKVAEFHREALIPLRRLVRGYLESH